jgi:hypothetical protein
MKERWTKQDYELLFWIIIIILMVVLIPGVWFYDWLNGATNWRQFLNFINWLLNKALEWVNSI